MNERNAVEDMRGLYERLQRKWYMLQYVPPRQIARRVFLRTSVYLETIFPPPLYGTEIPPASSRPPRSLLPPRHDQVASEGVRFALVMPWGRAELWPSPSWHMEASDEAKYFLRAALHNMEYLGALDESVALGLMKSWYSENTFDRKDARSYAWRPFNISLRVVAWMRELAFRRDRFRTEEVEPLHRSLISQMRYLCRRLETDIRGNHLLKNITALLWGGAYFAGAESGEWRQIGERLLDEELDEQILGDGGHFERSPSYQCQAIADLLDCLVVVRPGALQERIALAVERMVNALHCFLHPDGEVALFNDGGLHASWPPASVLAAWRAWGGRDSGPPNGAFALSDSGYWGFRRAGEYCIVDCGPMGPEYLIGHGHADILSFEWSTEGKRIIVDQGTYAYGAGPHRTASRSSSNHNTLTIQDVNQSDVYGAFRCGRRAKAVVLEWGSEGDGIRFRGTHDGFRHLPGRPRHERLIKAGPGRVEIHDRVLGNGSASGLARYLLHPACRIVDYHGERLVIMRDNIVIEVLASRPLRIVPAEWFPDMFTSVSTHRLVCEVPPGEPGVRVVFRSRPATEQVGPEQLS